MPNLSEYDRGMIKSRQSAHLRRVPQAALPTIRKTGVTPHERHLYCMLDSEYAALCDALRDIKSSPSRTGVSAAQTRRAVRKAEILRTQPFGDICETVTRLTSE